MTISLHKGEKINLTKEVPELTKVLVGLGWDANKYDGSSSFDLDASIFMVDVNGKTSDKDFIFYNNKVHESGSVEHCGDNLTGAEDGDDEQIKIDLTKVPSNIEKIAFTVTIYQADVRNQNFGQVSNAYIHLVDEITGSEVARFDLSEDFSIETAIVIGELYRNNNDWKFQAVGSGFQGGLSALCKNYGLDVK